MLAQLRDSIESPPFSDQALRDTIAAIAKDPAYTRAVGQSLWDRFQRFVVDQFARLFDAVSEVPFGRTVVIVLVILAVALVLARLVMGIVAERNAGHTDSRQGASTQRAAQLADAERLAANGEYTAAAHLLFAVVLAAGSARGEFRVHPSKTLGDYAREIRRRATAWQQPFAAFRHRFDRAMYRDTACSAEDYQALLTDVQAMLTRDRAA
jgi:hypothetical protein